MRFATAPGTTRITQAPRTAPAPPPARQGGLFAQLPGSARTGVLVRLELPDVDADDQQPGPDDPGSGALDSSTSGKSLAQPLNQPLDQPLDQPRNTLDPRRIERAVEALLLAIDPTLVPRVQVEFFTAPGEPAGVVAPARGDGAPLRPEGGFRLRADGDLTHQVDGDIAYRPDAGDLWPRADADGLVVDLGGRTIMVDGAPLVLTRREFELLAYLHRRSGIALSRRELMNAVWQTGYLEGDRTVDVHVRRLRVKLGSHAHRLGTLRGYGYRFD